jgi:hypothetical protein
MGLELILKFILAGIAGLAFFIAGVSILRPYLSARSQALDSLTWPETLGQVVKSGTRSKRFLTSNQTHARQYQPEIVYQYMVDGKAYESAQLMIAEGYFVGTHAWAKNIADRFPLDCQVRVYYDPAHPETAVLDRKSGYTQEKFVNQFLLVVLPGVVILLVLSYFF